MPREYELTRIAEQIKHLESDLRTAEHDKTRTARDEEFEVSKVRDEFRSKISRLDEAITRIKAEIRLKQSTLKKYEDEMKVAKNLQPSAAELDREERAARRSNFR